MKRELSQPRKTVENALWPALQTNSVGHLPPDLRERLLDELGFNWRSPGDFIVVTRYSVRDILMYAAGVEEEKLAEAAAAALAMTPEEREQVEAALLRVRTDLREWVVTHTERNEPKDGVVAQYTLQRDSTMGLSITNNFATAVSGALGGQRAELMLLSVLQWMSNMEIFAKEPVTLIVRRSTHFSRERFPRAFRPLFTNGWADVAKTEGFELPPPPEKK